MIRAKNAFAAPLIAVVLLLVLAAAAQANTIVVNVHDDPAGSGDCETTDSSCSLRQAINTAQPGDVLQLQGSDDSPVAYTVTQGSNLEIAQNVTVQGNGPQATLIDGSANTARILRVDNGTVVIQDLSMINGIDGSDETFSVWVLDHQLHGRRFNLPRRRHRHAQRRRVQGRALRAPTRWAAPSATGSAR